MQRTHRLPIIALATLALAGALAVAGAGAQGDSPSARAAGGARVQLRHTRLGGILVSSRGFTLYEFTRDHGAHNSCVAVRECAQFWPAYTTSGRPSAGPGVRSSLLSTIRIAGGKTQVTYAGHPLYLYSADSGPGETSYVGVNMFGGRWYALSAAGATIR
jgi:predicted lipoprotein with Yx(FWY)xxD motif